MELKQISSLTPQGAYFGPCAGTGNDIKLAFDVFGDAIEKFVFCDLAYNTRTTAQRLVPSKWELLLRSVEMDEQAPDKTTWYRSEKIRPHSVVETWKRPDGVSVVVELHNDLAQDLLIEEFPVASISAFVHINDSEGEGGSDLWFLGHKRLNLKSDEQCNRLLEPLATRLCDGAIVVTDGLLADPGFSGEKDFTTFEKKWEFIMSSRDAGRPNREVRFWRAFDL